MEPMIDVVMRVVRDEVERAMKKFPGWPSDPVHAAAIVAEEAGELVQAALQETYEPHRNEPGACRTEAIQTAAMAIRYILADSYMSRPDPLQVGE